jgi:D-alanyl-D-alanine dipeptidase
MERRSTLPLVPLPSLPAPPATPAWPAIPRLAILGLLALIGLLAAACGAPEHPAGDRSAAGHPPGGLPSATESAVAGAAKLPADTAAWRALIGDYHAAGDTLILRERAGMLEALLGADAYATAPVATDRLELRGHGARDGALLHVERSAEADAGAADPRANAVVLDDVVYQRLRYGVEGDETFRIRPVQPVETLRRRALAASPPEEGHLRTPDLVDLETLDPTLRFDIRYATTNNFMGAVFYPEPRALLQRPAAEAMLRAHHRLRDHGLGLLVYDAYRPWFVTWMFWHATPPELRMFVANPAAGSRHNRGAAVDVTLYDLATGEIVPMPSGYDEFSPRAFPDYPGGTTEERANRDALRQAMEAEGFRVYYAEWWHFDHRDWRRYPIMNLPFDRATP